MSVFQSDCNISIPFGICGNSSYSPRFGALSIFNVSHFSSYVVTTHQEFKKKIHTHYLFVEAVSGFQKN